MKIAFVGKGGSGKSTITALFIRYLQTYSKGNVLAIDADLNMNLAGLLGLAIRQETLLANPDVGEAIRQHLKGRNTRIKDTSKFLPTTPPGYGSNLIRNADDPILLPLSVQVSSDPLINLLTVGSYDRDGIGQTCYHSHLFVAENLLSHTVTSEDFAVVCDMVAGTDAFAYSLHLQFDAIFLITEPTPESIEVCKLYLDLAEESGVGELIHLVANQIADEEDLDFIGRHIDRQILTSIPFMTILKKTRQRGEAIGESILTPSLTETMRTIENSAKSPVINAAKRLEMLQQLHRKLNAKNWVKLGYGDVLDQIDPDFQIDAQNNKTIQKQQVQGVLA